MKRTILIGILTGSLFAGTGVCQSTRYSQTTTHHKKETKKKSVKRIGGGAAAGAVAGALIGGGKGAAIGAAAGGGAGAVYDVHKKHQARKSTQAEYRNR
jgi:hypothetical protein